MPYNFKCKVCPKNYIVVSEFIEHVKIHVDEDERADNKKTENEQRIGASMLQRSIDIKLENEEIKSYICGKDYGELLSVIQESKVENEIEKANSCDKTFSHRSNLQEHLKISHKKLDPYLCDVCDKSFRQETSLKAHVTHVTKAMAINVI